MEDKKIPTKTEVKFKKLKKPVDIQYPGGNVPTLYVEEVTTLIKDIDGVERKDVTEIPVHKEPMTGGLDAHVLRLEQEILAVKARKKELEDLI